MTPLMLRIQLGFEDDRLLEHIEALLRAKYQSHLSPREVDTWHMLYERLDIITSPGWPEKILTVTRSTK